MRSRTHYVVEKDDGYYDWQTSNMGALFKRGPKVFEGMVHLHTGDYTVYPRYNRREIRKRFPPIPWPKQEDLYALFVEGLTAQIPFFNSLLQVKEMQEYFAYSAGTVSQAAESKLTSEYLHPSLNWGMLFLAMLGGIGIGAIAMEVIRTTTGH